MTLTGPEYPPTSNNPKQLILFLHGVGADGHDLISLAPLISEQLPDAHFCSPNAPFPCDMAPTGYQWFSLLDYSEDALYEGIKESAPLLNQFIDEKLDALGLTDKDLALVGFSQGTMMSLYTAPRRPTACAAIVGFSGRLIKPNLLSQEGKSTPAACLIHGDADMVVPHSSLYEAETALNTYGIEVEAHTRPNLGHGIDEQGLQSAIQFLKKQLTT